MGLLTLRQIFPGSERPCRRELALTQEPVCCGVESEGDGDTVWAPLWREGGTFCFLGLLGTDVLLETLHRPLKGPAQGLQQRHCTLFSFSHVFHCRKA